MGEGVVSKSILGFVLPAVNGTACKPCDTRELNREPPILHPERLKS